MIPLITSKSIYESPVVLAMFGNGPGPDMSLIRTGQTTGATAFAPTAEKPRGAAPGETGQSTAVRPFD